MALPGDLSQNFVSDTPAIGGRYPRCRDPWKHAVESIASTPARNLVPLWDGLGRASRFTSGIDLEIVNTAVVVR